MLDLSSPSAVIARGQLLFLLIFIFICFWACGVFAADKVEINTALLQQLDEITGIGPVLAQRIIDARPFSSVDDLLRVNGIGTKTLQKIKDQGLAYVAGETQQTPIPTPTPAASTTPIVYPTGIIISKIMPSPEGPDDKGEWIEISNKNDFEVDLNGWQITDTAGSVKTYTFPENSKIAAKEQLILARETSKITLNNDGDGLKIISPDKQIADTVSYKNAEMGKIISFINSNPDPKVITNATNTEIKLASVVSTIKLDKQKRPGFLSPIAIALFVSLVSGVIISFLKVEIKKKSAKIR